MAADAAAMPAGPNHSSSVLSAFGTAPGADVDDAAFKQRDNCRNVAESTAAVILHVVNKQMMYSMTPDVLDVLCVLNEHTWTKY